MQYFDHFNVAFALFNPTRVSDLGPSCNYTKLAWNARTTGKIHGN
jgi:hypothetical protein